MRTVESAITDTNSRPGARALVGLTAGIVSAGGARTGGREPLWVPGLIVAPDEGCGLGVSVGWVAITGAGLGCRRGVGGGVLLGVGLGVGADAGTGVVVGWGDGEGPQQCRSQHRLSPPGSPDRLRQP